MVSRARPCERGKRGSEECRQHTYSTTTLNTRSKLRWRRRVLRNTRLGRESTTFADCPTMTDTPPQASTSYPTTNMTSLTDAQLRQTITQLSNAATSQFQPYAAAGTQAAPSKGQFVSKCPSWRS